MKKVDRYNLAPKGSIIANGFDRFQYCDSYKVEIQTNEPIDSLLTRVFKIPDFTKLLMKIRNTVVSIFGLKTGKGRLIKQDFYPIGGKAIYFTVVDRNDNEIVMQEDDKHLNFRVSLFMNSNNISKEVFMTTLVKYNNLWGRIYFLPVRPFHRMIVKYLMKQLIIFNILK